MPVLIRAVAIPEGLAVAAFFAFSFLGLRVSSICTRTPNREVALFWNNLANSAAIAMATIWLFGVIAILWAVLSSGVPLGNVMSHRFPKGTSSALTLPWLALALAYVAVWFVACPGLGAF